MGNYFFNISNHELNTTKLPQMNVGSQMQCIVMYWIRKTDAHLVGKIPIDIIHLIIHRFVYQEIFETENKYKLEYPEWYQQTVQNVHSMSVERATERTNDCDYDFLFKLLLIGDSGVGKTSLLRQYCDDDANRALRAAFNVCTTIGVDFQIKTIDVDAKRIKLQVWDTAGQERSLYYSCYRGAHGILLVYDIANRESFEHIKKWNGEIDKCASDQVSRILVGNKCDLLDTHSNGEFVSIQEAKNMCQSLNIEDTIQTSAKNGNRVDDAFESITRMIMSIVVHRDRRVMNPFYG
eukprot:104270_1